MDSNAKFVQNLKAAYIFIRYAFVLRVADKSYKIRVKLQVNFKSYFLLYMYAECLQFKTEYTECHKKSTYIHMLYINKAN